MLTPGQVNSNNRCAFTQRCHIPSLQRTYQQVFGSWPLLATVLAAVYLIYGIAWRLVWSRREPVGQVPGSEASCCDAVV